MNCCGGARHEITVQSGASTLMLIRCSQCTQQIWSIDGVLVEREEAFAHLSGAYRDIPQAAQAARSKAIAGRAAREAARAALTVPEQEIRLPAEPDTSELASLLDGWKVLGATG